MNRKIIALLFILSGAAGLIYQVVWTRSLTLLFGSTTLAVSTVLTAFMAGLALGSWFFGRIADRVKKALPVYALLEVGIAVTALLFPVLIHLLTPVWLKLHQSLHDSYLLLPLGRFLVSFLGLLLPTAFMGGTLPVITRFFVKERRTFGGNVSVLYALNTFGAMIGCFGAGFFLIPEFGISGVIWLGALLNLVAAAGALLVSRTEGRGDSPVEAAKEEVAAGEGAIPPRAILWLFGMAGFASLAYEVLWTRALLFFLGWFAVYAFTIILTTFLFGIALGSALFPLFFKSTRRLVIGFGIIEIAIGVFGAFSVAVFGGLFELIRSLEHALAYDNWWRFIFARAGGSFAVVLLPTFLMGLAFPVASAIYARAGKGYGRTVGNVYAANTVGAILGSLLAGFLLLPVLGVARSIAAVSLINLLIGGVVLFLRSRGTAYRTAGAVVLLAVIAGGGGNLVLSKGRPMVLQSRHFKNPDRKMELLYADEGATASLAVLLDKDSGHFELNINGESTAYTTYTDMQVHLMLSHTPLLLAERPEKVLVIGFGMGSTSYGAVLYPTVKSVHCVELVPKEVETAPYFRNVNHGVLDDPKFDLIIDDGRTYVFTTEERYDLISFNAIHPSHSPALYTSDFYEQCRRKMTDDGLICAWVPTNSFTELQFQILLKTFLSVFPQSSLWYVNPNHLVLIGALGPLRVDFDRFLKTAAQPEVRRDLARYTMEDPYRLLAYHLMDDEALDRYTRNIPVNSDDKPYLEYSRELYTRPEIIDAMLYHRSSVFPDLDVAGEGGAVEERLRRYEKAAFHLLAAQAVVWLETGAGDEPGKVWRTDIELREALRYLPGDDNLYVIAGITDEDGRQFRAITRAEPNSDAAWNKLLRLHRMRGEWDEVASLLDEMGGTTDEALLTRGMLGLRRKEWARASATFRRLAREGESPLLREIGGNYDRITALEEKRDLGEMEMEERIALAESRWAVGDRDEGEAVFREALALHPGRPLVPFSFGRALERSHRFTDAAEAYAAALALPIKRDDFRKLAETGCERSILLSALAERPNEARAVEGWDGRTIDVDPWSPEFRVRLGRLLMEEGFAARASVEFRVAATLDPENADAREGLGLAFAERGFLSEARSELRRALAIDPSRDSARRALDRLP